MTVEERFDAASLLLPPGAEAARLIVCERSGRWAVALRREIGDPHVRIHETRSLTECWETLGNAPASFVIVELTRPAVADLLGRMSRLQSDFPLARTAIVARRSLSDYQWLMREAGATHFTSSPRQLAPLARLACRHLRQTPPPPRDLTMRFFERLPWRPVG